MTFIKNNWVAVLIFIVVLILVIRYIQKTKTESTTPGQQLQQVFSIVASNLSPVPTLTSVLPGSTTTTTTGFKFGDKIYAKENYTNAYKNPVLSTANLDSYKPFMVNDLIGVFSAYSGNFVKVIASNPARTIYVQTSQVYTK